MTSYDHPSLVTLPATPDWLCCRQKGDRKARRCDLFVAALAFRLFTMQPCDEVFYVACCLLRQQPLPDHQLSDRP